MAQDLKIWDKKTGTSRKPLKLFKDHEPQLENVTATPHAGYSSKEKAMIVEAQRIMNERRKNRDSNGKEQKEGIIELLEQKKEMFLVEMTVGIIEKERETLIQKAGEKEDALKKSEDMLEKDLKEFESYKHNNKHETDQAVQKYNQEVELRKRTETEYKIKNNDLTSLKAERAKNEELIQKYLDARNFLDKLTPKEVTDQKEREFNKQVEEFKAHWMEKEMLSRDESQSALIENTTKVVSNRDKKGPGKKNQRLDLEKNFSEKLDKGEFDELEEFKLNQKTHFTEPEQLVEIFTRLEEGNLALIQMMQDTEQSLENLQNTLKQKKVEFDKKIYGLRENKMQLEKSKNEKEEKVKALELRSKEPRLAKKYDGMAPLTEKIKDVISIFRDEIKGPIDQDNLLALDLLAMVELHLEKQLEKLNEYKPARILELKRTCEDTRKGENRKLQLERENGLADERRAKANDRAKEKAKKRKGRLDMMKSTPMEKKEAVTQVVQTNEEEEDMKYFRPYMTKY